MFRLRNQYTTYFKTIFVQLGYRNDFGLCYARLAREREKEYTSVAQSTNATGEIINSIIN